MSKNKKNWIKCKFLQKRLFSGLTLTKCVDGVVSLSHINDVAMLGWGCDVEQQGCRVAVSVLCSEHLGADGEPQVTCGQDLQRGSPPVHHDLRDAIINRHNGDFQGLRAPGLKHRVREDKKVSVRAVGDGEREGVLRGFGPVVLVTDAVLVEVLFGKAGDGRGAVVEEFAVNGQLCHGEFQQLLGRVLVLGGELKRRYQLNLPFCDHQAIYGHHRLLVINIHDGDSESSKNRIVAVGDFKLETVHFHLVVRGVDVVNLTAGQLELGERHDGNPGSVCALQVASDGSPRDGEGQVLIGAVEVRGAEKVCGQGHSATFFQRHAFADHIGEHGVYAAHGDVEVTVN